MPTVCGLKEELRQLGVRGYSKKSKAELEEMLEDARPRAYKAAAPRKVTATAVPNPAAREYKTVSKPAIERQAPSYKAPDVPEYKAPAAKEEAHDPEKLNSNQLKTRIGMWARSLGKKVVGLSTATKAKLVDYVRKNNIPTDLDRKSVV